MARKRADKTTNYQKGDILFVEGRILTDSYEDASTGQRKWTTEVEARQLVNFNDVFSDAQPSASAPIPPDVSVSASPNDAFASASSEPVENLPFPLLMNLYSLINPQQAMNLKMNLKKRFLSNIIYVT